MNRDAEKLARQWIAIQRAGTYIGLHQQALIESLFEDILTTLKRRGTPAQVAKRVTKLIDQMNSAAYATLVKDMREIASLTSANAALQVAALGGSSKAPKITDAQLKRWLTATPMVASNTTVADLHHATYESAKRQARGAVLLGHTADEGATATASRMKVIRDQMLRRVAVNTATSTNVVANNAKEHAFKGAKRRADRVMWVSTLDPVTSDFCMAADGKVFPIDKGPRPPAHPHCRSTVVLVGKDEKPSDVQADMVPRPAVEATSKKLMDKYGIRTKKYGPHKGGKYRGASRDDKSPLKGVRTRHKTYASWLKDQPKYYQEKILGKKAAAKFRGGKSLNSVLRERSSSINFDSLSEALRA